MFQITCIEQFSLPYCKGAPKDPKAHALKQHLQKNNVNNHQASTPLLFGRSMSPELLYCVSSFSREPSTKVSLFALLDKELQNAKHKITFGSGTSP